MTPADRSDWLAWRKQGVTATDIADAANGTYGGIYAVVARKLDLLDPEEETDQMRRGTRWQPTIADAVHVLTGWHVVGEETWCEHGVDPRWRATVDDEPVDAEIVDEPADTRSVIDRLREQMTTEQRGEVRAFMGERGIISLAAADDQDLDAIAAECERIIGAQS